MTPLFIPLKTEFYEAFKSGDKDTEYRLYGPRWNEDTCKVGRPVVLSKGYGKYARMRGVVKEFYVNKTPWKLKGWEECYGQSRIGMYAACIKIKLSKR